MATLRELMAVLGLICFAVGAAAYWGWPAALLVVAPALLAPFVLSECRNGATQHVDPVETDQPGTD